MCFFGRQAASAEVTASGRVGTNDLEKSSHADAAATTPLSKDQHGEAVDSDLQDGVAKVEAATLVWTKRDLILAYAL
jgi:hypothetical protein